MRTRSWVALAGVLALGAPVVATAEAAEDVNEQGKREIQKGGEKVEEGSENFGESMSSAAEEMAEPARKPRGIVDEEPVHNTLTADPVAIITGAGINAQYMRPLDPKLSGVVGANFARAPAAEGRVTNFSAHVGADYYVIGRNNEGLRVGPRLSAGLGRETIGESSNFYTFGVAGELGYNWIAENGVTAGAAGGVGSNFAAITNQPDEDNFAAYAKLNLGYSW